MLRDLYLKGVLGRPWIAIVLFLAMAGYFAVQLPDFKLSAGTSALVLEGDDTKVVYDNTRELFTSDDYLLVAVQPKDAWTPEGIALVDELTRELAAIDGITSVLSPTTAPLFTCSPAMTCVLTDDNVDLVKARKELTEFPLYSNQLASADGSILNLLAFFKSADPEALRREYRRLVAEIEASDAPTSDMFAKRDAAAQKVLDAKAQDAALHRRLVTDVRSRLPKYRERGAIVHASGLPSLSVDMVDYLEHDIRVFGIAVSVFLLLTLLVLFRKPRFVILPLVTCLITVVSIMGLTVVMGVETTIVTSNMSSLLFIIGMAHSIHLVVKYREERALHPERDDRETIWAAVRGIGKPCLFTALTTAVGFASLRITDIEPVKDFALFMTLGVLLAFGVSLLFLPASLAALRPPSGRVEDATGERRNPLLAFLANLALRHRPAVYGVSLLITAVAAYGVSQVRVDQRFVEYFDEDTEVHQGLSFVDEVGGTMTVEVILWGDDDGYWLKPDAYKRVAAVHDWFDQQGPQVGKVLSLVSFDEHVRLLLKAKMPFLAGAPLQQLVAMLPMALQSAGPDAKEKIDAVLSQVVTSDQRVTRVYVRLRENTEELNRIKILDDLRAFLAASPDLEIERAKAEGQQPTVTGMFVLFTNMLNTLVGSQMKSFLWVFVAVAAMLALLFRNVGVGLLAMPPNLLPIALVLGMMGLAAITLDLMTIMIASISLGIAVDACIHYVVRYRAELRRSGDVELAVQRAHQSIGKAILYTALTVFVGFFVMVLSKFTPTRYFGMLTGVAMVASLLANLILLPALLISLRAFRREAGADRDAS